MVKSLSMASPVMVSVELGPQDTSGRSQPDKGGKHNAQSLSSYGEPQIPVSHPIHLHWKFFSLSVVCIAIPFLISMGSGSLGFSSAGSERLQEPPKASGYKRNGS